jgi:predicted nucleic acid-binding protein
VKPVFLDTVGLLGLWNDADQWHLFASAAFAKLAATRTPLVTTREVLLECGNAAARTSMRSEVADLRSRLESQGRLIIPADVDWTNAWAEYERGSPGDPGIVDCVSFAVMRRLNLADAFTNDQHFAAAGFTPLF